MKQIPLSPLCLIHFKFFCITPSFSLNPLEALTYSEAFKSMDHTGLLIKIREISSLFKTYILGSYIHFLMHKDDVSLVIAAGFTGQLPICLHAAIKVGRAAIKDRSAHAVNS